MLRDEGYFKYGPERDNYELYYLHSYEARKLFSIEEYRDGLGRKEQLILGIMAEQISSLCADINDRDLFIEDMMQGRIPENIRYPFSKAKTERKTERTVHTETAAAETDNQELLSAYIEELGKLRREL